MKRIFAGLTLAGILGVCAWNAAPVSAQKEGDSAPQDKARPERKAHPEQASVATKKEFATVGEKDAAVTKALDASKLTELKKLEDKDATFKGTIAKVYTSRGNSMMILNFADNYKEAATAVLRPKYYDKFPDMEKLDGKKVVVSGKIVIYKGQPEIMLTKPEQIKVIK